jgi:nicotinate phosphoribosyltransferase
MSGRQTGTGTAPSPLCVDLYQLTMGQAYLDAGLAGRSATFSLFYRTTPAGWGYLLTAGLERALDYLEQLAFGEQELAYLESTGLFTGDFLDRLGRLRFTGDVRALPEGTLLFPNEPVLEVTAPVLEAQLVETVVLNELHFGSLIAGKAARSVDVAAGCTLVDFGLRRAHGPEAGLNAARSAYIAGFDATSNVLAGREFGLPVAGTMAHSFVETFAGELEAFQAFAAAYPDRSILLVDTYDTIEGTRRAIEIGRRLETAGHRLAGVRLDSGDLLTLARESRRLLDEAGFEDAVVFASGGLDEHDVGALLAGGAPIGGFGIGTKLVTAADSPYLDMAYKLVEFDGNPTLKLSSGKATLPGAKQLWRVSGEDGFAYDVVDLVSAPGPADGDSLLVEAMRGGRRVFHEPLEAARRRAAEQRALLPERHRRLDAEAYDVRIGPALARLNDQTARRLRRGRRGAERPPARSGDSPMPPS